MARERWLITGASSGIGLELARLAAGDGRDLILTARSAEKLDRLADGLGQSFGVDVAVVPLDLSEPGAAWQLGDRIDALHLQVDGVINNAGFGLYGPFLTADPAEEVAMVRLNVEALTALTKRFLPAMVRRGRGRIMNVASIAAFLPGPGMAVYHATKAYVLSLTEALALELKGTGVTVTALCPGPTPSGFEQRAGMQFSGPVQALLTDPAMVARAGYRAMLQGKRVAVPGAMNRLVPIAVRLVPTSWVAAISSHAWKK